MRLWLAVAAMAIALPAQAQQEERLDAPFIRMTATINALRATMLQGAGWGAVIGPMLIGMEKPVQIAPMTAIAPEVLTLAVLASAGVAA